MSDSNVAGNIIQILAGLPEFLRKPMLKSRLEEFFTMDEDEKKETVTNALNAAPTIDFKVLSNLVKTWMEVLCEFDEDKRKAMFGAYVDVISISPEMLKELNIDGLISIFNSLPDEKKKILSDSLKNLIDELPDEKNRNFVSAIPDNAKETLKI